MASKYNLKNTRKEAFQKAVIAFYANRGRIYPWRQSVDPYEILVAEVLIKLTGAGKAEPVYRKLIAIYGDPKLMSEADIGELEEMIRPLGLINRAKMLVDLSKTLVENFEGHVPEDYSALTSLKGVGRYTANAVLCLAYGIRVPLVDESVKRVFARCLNFPSKKPAHMDEGLWSFATGLLPKRKVKEYNLGLIDLGALFCKHSKSSCVECPVNLSPKASS